MEKSLPYTRQTFAPRQPKIELRNYFPENWLFELIEIETNSRTVLTR